MKETIKNILIGVLTLGLTTAFGWIWHMETRMVLVEDHQVTSKESRKVATDLIKDWPGYKKQIDANTDEIGSLFDHWEESTKEAKTKELLGLQRLQAVETKIEIYH
tara:strand:- start:13465 stop:13782 length:318 start_codon:yes stop_codon:yes gene_type:complete